MIKKFFSDWQLFELIWLLTFSAIATGLTFIWKDTFFGLTVFLTGVLCVVLTAKGSIWSYCFGFFNTLGYAYIAYTNQLFGEMGLNIMFFLPMNFVGFYMWRRHLNPSHQVIMQKMTVFWLMVTVGICFIGALALGYLLSMLPTQNTPYIDATTNILSIVATVLTVKRFREQWLLYIVLNVFTILMWSIRMANGSPEGPMMIVMWSAYLINAFYGYYNWSKGVKRSEEAVPV